MGPEVSGQRRAFGQTHPAELVERLRRGGLHEHCALAILVLGFLDRHDARQAEEIGDRQVGRHPDRVAQRARAPRVLQAERDVRPHGGGASAGPTQGDGEVDPTTGDPPLDQPADVGLV